VKEEDDKLPTDCGVCAYHARPTKECRRHAPHPGHDEAFVIALWHFTHDRDRCGAGSTKKQIVACDDCIHWWRPDDKPLDPPYKQGLPDAWWEHAAFCTANAPGPTTHESLWTYWPVTSTYPMTGFTGTAAGGGCGDGVSIAAMREAEKKKSGG
jgi:hypothetical protein